MSAIVISDSVVMVTWEEVPEQDRNGVIIVYEVLLLSPAGDADVSITNTTDLTVNVTGLEGDILYNVTVSAYTSVGHGPPSFPPVQAMTEPGGKRISLVYSEVISLLPTLAAGPVAGPPEVPVENISSSSALLIWDIPDRPNGIILSYTVRLVVLSSVEDVCITRLGRGVDENITVDGNQTSLQVSMLGKCA